MALKTKGATFEAAKSVGESAFHTVLVGGSRGLGLEIARTLLKQGQGKVSVLSRSFDLASLSGDKDDFESSINLERLVHVACDFKDVSRFPSAVEQIINRHGPVNRIVFTQRSRLPAEDSYEKWDNEMQISVRATMQFLELFKEHFSQTGGAVVIVGSMGGRSYVDSQSIEYGVAKAALDQLVRHYCVELGPLGVRVNAVTCFTFVKPGRSRSEKESSVIERVVPLGRMPRADELVSAILFLSSPKASFISGQSLLVDGGLSAVGQETIAFWASGMRTKGHE